MIKINKSSYFHKVIIWAIEVLVQLDHQRLEERGKLSLLFGGFILGHGRLQSKYCNYDQKYKCQQYCFKYLYIFCHIGSVLEKRSTMVKVAEVLNCK